MARQSEDSEKGDSRHIQCFTDLAKVEQVLQQIADELGDIDMELTAHLIDVCILSLRDEAEELLRTPRGSC